MKARYLRIATYCVIIILTIVVSINLVPSVSAAEKNTDLKKTFKWRANTFHPANHAGGQSLTIFCDLVRNMSGGRLDITPYLGATLLKGGDSFDGLKNGIVEVAALYAAYHHGKVPECFTESGANGVMSRYIDEHGFWYFDGNANEYMRKVYEPYNIRFLGFSFGGPVGICSRVPIRTAADFKGLKIRTGGVLALQCEELGAKTVHTPIGEAYTALQLGTIDAATYTDLGSFVNLGWHEVAKYAVTELFKEHGGTSMSMNLKAWNSLPDDLKAIVMAATELSCIAHEYYDVTANVKARKVMEAAGCEIVKFSLEETAKVAAARNKAIDKLVEKNPRYKEGVDLYRAWYLERGYKKDW